MELACPRPYIAKPNAESLVCFHELCNWDIDRNICCDRRSECNPEMKCPSGTYLKTSNAFCAKATCDPETDIDYCCDQQSPSLSIPRLIYNKIYPLISWPLIFLKHLGWYLFLPAYYILYLLYLAAYVMLYMFYLVAYHILYMIYVPAKYFFICTSFLVKRLVKALYYLSVLICFILVGASSYVLLHIFEGDDLARSLKLGVQALVERCIELCPLSIIPKDIKIETVTSQETLHEIQDLFDLTFQDRKYKGTHKVTKLTVIGAKWVRNPRVYKEYLMKMREIKHFNKKGAAADGIESVVPVEDILSHQANTSSILSLGWGKLISSLEKSTNEALMFHATSPANAESILKSRVLVPKEGANGDLYGVGTYFAESPSKADTYAIPNDDNQCAMIINRVILGKIYTTMEKKPDITALSRALKAGGCHSICGDRRDIVGHFGGWREFVTDKKDQSMPLLMVLYTRDGQNSERRDERESENQI